MNVDTHFSKVERLIPGDLPGEQLSSLFKQYAADANFRSAHVSELTDSSEGFRRPLRPEDLSFLKLAAIDDDNASSLCALACNRALSCIYEQSTTARLPSSSDPVAWQDCARFYGHASALLGESIRPSLVELVFGGLDATVPADRARPRADSLLRLFEERRAEERRIRALAEGAPRSAEILRMAWLQHLEASRGALQAFERAFARGLFGESLAPLLVELRARVSALAPNYERLGLSPATRAHFQFCLPTTLAQINYNHSVVHSPCTVVHAVASLLYTLLAQRAFEHCFSSQAPRQSDEAFARQLTAAWESSAQGLSHRFGGDATLEIAKGLSLCRALQIRSDRDRSSQFEWLAHFEQYAELGQGINRLISDGELVVDRETFVEPREMCSTTHVHDDHRLVVIESGVMVFWAAPGMRVTAERGEVLLVPKGRLHGSSIESEECVYHQPILQDSMVRLKNSTEGREQSRELAS